MRIVITDIRARIIDASTKEESNFIIQDWIVSYHITFSPVDVISGSIEWSAVPVMHTIIKFLTHRYAKVSPHN